MMKSIRSFLILIILTGCMSEYEYSCVSLLWGCNTDSPFCTFGLKWGESSEFSPSGSNITGPGTAGGTVSFSFMKEGHQIKTHSENGIVSKSFEAHQLGCAKDEIRNAFNEYSKIANIDFLEDIQESGDIKIYAAELQVAAMAYPKIIEPSCADLSGRMIFNTKVRTCPEYYLVALHEVGHALGLGHVTTSNIMKDGPPNLSFDGLQPGDIEGVQSIYGKR